MSPVAWWGKACRGDGEAQEGGKRRRACEEQTASSGTHLSAVLSAQSVGGKVVLRDRFFDGASPVFDS